MLFQGQEFAASSPFFYFGNVAEALAESIHNARLKFLSQFRTIALAETQATIRRPSDRATFELSKIDHSERVKHAEAYALHCDLLKLRREDPVLAAQKKGAFDGAVLGSHAFVMRFFDNVNYDRLLVVNLGRDLRLEPAPEPLLAPLENAAWDIQWSSESHAYGGNGTPALEEDDIWRIPGEAAIVLRPVPRKAESKR
jgi:maltooligosyltrehalose trehalohydrolase